MKGLAAPGGQRQPKKSVPPRTETPTAEKFGLDPAAFESARSVFINASARERKSNTLAQMIRTYLDEAEDPR